MNQQIEKNEPWSAKASPNGLMPFCDTKFLGGRGPQDQLKVGPFDHWTIQKMIPTRRWAEGPANIYICIYPRQGATATEWTVPVGFDS